MAVKVVGILSPGDMGHAVGSALRANGLEVVTTLEGRSDRTWALARRAHIRDVGPLASLVAEADLVLSILVPAEAVEVARSVASALRATRADTTFVDCNAVSPQSAETMSSIISDVGGWFIDGSIIGGPPRRGSPPPRFYVSGPDTRLMTELDGKGIAVRPIGDAIGRASGIKMCYAAMTKGTSALHVALLTVAEALGLSDELRTELQYSQSDAYARMESAVPGLAGKAFRWIGEMEEIASTFEQVGVTPAFHRGAADVFRLLGNTPFAAESPETIDTSRTLAETISAVAALLPSRADERK